LSFAAVISTLYLVLWNVNYILRDVSCNGNQKHFIIDFQHFSKHVILLCVPQKKDNHTGLERHDDE